MKLDIHLNVGRMYRTAKANSLEMFYTGKEIADYCNFFKLTHCVCIYDKYENLKELIDNAPNTKVYGVQWVVDLEDQELDIGKEGWYGIKLHSHRGYRDSRKYDRTKPTRKSTQEEWASKPLSYGLDYADKYIKIVLDKLPTGSLVYMHTQGGASLTNRATSDHVFMLATEYRNLKFIMGHAGNYGGMTVSKPAFKDSDAFCEHVAQVSKDKLRGPLRNYIDGFVSPYKSFIYALMCHNLFLDSSCFYEGKGIAFANSVKWAIGSDYPFGNNKRTKGQHGNEETVHFTVDDFKRKSYIWNYDKQADLFAKMYGCDVVEATSRNALYYLNTPVDVLAKQQIASYNQKINYEMIFRKLSDSMLEMFDEE